MKIKYLHSAAQKDSRMIHQKIMWLWKLKIWKLEGSLAQTEMLLGTKKQNQTKIMITFTRAE